MNKSEFYIQRSRTTAGAELLDLSLSTTSRIFWTLNTKYVQNEQMQMQVWTVSSLQMLINQNISYENLPSLLT